MLRNRSSLFLYGLSGAAVVVLYFVLKVSLPKDSFVYSLLFRAWQLQFLNSWLFLIGVVYWIQRYSFFRREEEAFEGIKLPSEALISRERAAELIEAMPDEQKQTLTLRRFREVLQAFLYGEDLIRLNEELSRRDIAEVDRGHLILNSLRNIIPIIGFLGTVIGLSLGMLKFPPVTDPATLKSALEGFAASLSVAFNTTLLALGYTIVIVLLTSFLRQREEALVSKVDEGARILVGKIKIEVVSQAAGPQKGIEHLAQILTGIERTIREGGKILSQRFEEMKEEIHRPPRYQVIVKPLEEKEDER